MEGRGRSYAVEAVLAGDIGELKISPENVAYEQTEDREAYTDFVNEAYLQVPEEFREKWRIRHGFFEEEHFAAQSGRWRIILEQLQIIQKARGEHRMERISLNIFLEKAARDTAFILLQQVYCS